MIGPGVPEAGRAKEALKHFASAFAFLLLGIIALACNSEELSLGNTGVGSVVGGLHLITLGWLSLSIFGALQVFMGVALGESIPDSWIVPWTRRLWSAGTLAFAAGLILGALPLLAPGTLLLGSALILLSVQLVPALLASKRGALTRNYVWVALASLWSAWTLGTLAGLARGGWIPLGLPSGYFQAHILLAVFGWTGAMVAGVGSHLVPMFALSKPVSSLPIKAALPFWAAIPAAAAISAFWPMPWMKIAWSLAAIASALWILQFLLYFMNRLRKDSDPGLAMAACATGALGAAWAILLLGKAQQAFAGTLVIGWLLLFTLGIYHRVVPFLVWFVRFAGRAGASRAPKIKDLLDRRLTGLTAVSAVSGVAVWSFGILTHHWAATFAGALSLLLGALSALAQLRSLTRDQTFLGETHGVHARIPHESTQPGH